MSLIVDVIGATVTSPKYSNIVFLVSITTGRFLSGLLNLYHLTSPLFINHPIPALIPKHRILFYQLENSHNLFYVFFQARLY